MKSAINKHVLLTLMVIALSGCATRHADVSQSQSTAHQELNALQHWAIRGKLAIITANERKSAYLSWQQQDDNVTMTLTTVVGTTIAKLFYDGDMATLVADNQTWQDISPSALIFQATGWQVPVESLKYWMKGQVNDNLVTRYFDNGLVKEMYAEIDNALPWKISYRTYAEFSLYDTQYTLPTAMRLEQKQTNTSLILRIDDWKPKDVE